MDNANVYVWYSKSSEDSGKMIAKLIGTEQHGTLPPKEFSGTLVCYGAIPGEKFKWEERSPKFILNDPRHIRKFADRSAMFAALEKAGISGPKVVKVEPNMTFNGACQSLGVAPFQGVTMFKAGGAGAKLVLTDQEFNQEKALGMACVSSPEFLTDKRIRLFIAGGNFVGATGRSNGNHGTFAKMAAKEQNVIEEKGKAEALILHLLETGVINGCKTYWQPLNAVDPVLVEAATKAASALGFDFCAVDMLDTGNGVAKVLNVVTTPDIVSPAMEMLHAPLADSLKLWLKRSFKSAKEILSDLAAEANEEQAQVIVSELRKIKAEAVKQVG